MSIELHNTQKKRELLERDNINDLELLPAKEAENGEFEDFSLELTSKQMIRDSHRQLDLSAMQDHVIERSSNHNQSNHSNNRIDLDDIRDHEHANSNSKNSNNRMSNHSLKNLQSSSKKDNYKTSNSNDGQDNKNQQDDKMIGLGASMFSRRSPRFILGKNTTDFSTKQDGKETAGNNNLSAHKCEFLVKNLLVNDLIAPGLNQCSERLIPIHKGLSMSTVLRASSLNDYNLRDSDMRGADEIKQITAAKLSIGGLVIATYECLSILVQSICLYLLSIALFIGYSSSGKTALTTMLTITLLVAYILDLVFIIWIAQDKRNPKAESASNSSLFSFISLKSTLLSLVFQKSTILFDILPLISPLIAICSYGIGNSTGFENILEAIQFVKIVSLRNKITSKIAMLRPYHLFLAFFEIAFFFSLFLHATSIAFYNVSRLEKAAGVTTTWLESFEVQDSEYLKAYVCALYQIQILSLGSNFQRANESVLDMLFIVIVRLMTLLLFFWLAFSLQMKYWKYGKERSQKKEQFRVLGMYMQRQGVGKNLRSSIIRALQPANEEQHLSLTAEMIRSLPRNVTLQLNSYFFSRFSQNFMHRFSRQLINSIPQILHHEFVPPNTTIFPSSAYSYNSNNNLQTQLQQPQQQQQFHSQSSNQQFSMYFLIEGEVELFHSTSCTLPQKNKLIRSYKTGEIFGMSSFFSGQTNEFTATSKSPCQLLRLPRDEFIALTKQLSSTKDFEEFAMIRDSLQQALNNEYTQQFECELCGQSGHISDVCDTVFYVPEKDRVLDLDALQNSEERDSTFIRRKNKNSKKTNSWNIRQHSFQQFKELQRQHDQTILEYCMNYLGEDGYYIPQKQNSSQSQSKSYSIAYSNTHQQNNNNINSFSSNNDFERFTSRSMFLPMKQNLSDDTEILLQRLSSGQNCSSSQKIKSKTIGERPSNQQQMLLDKGKRRRVLQDQIKFNPHNRIQEEAEDVNFYTNFAAASELLSVKDIKENFFDSPKNNLNVNGNNNFFSANNSPSVLPHLNSNNSSNLLNTNNNNNNNNILSTYNLNQTTSHNNKNLDSNSNNLQNPNSNGNPSAGVPFVLSSVNNLTINPAQSQQNNYLMNASNLNPSSSLLSFSAFDNTIGNTNYLLNSNNNFQNNNNNNNNNNYQTQNSGNAFMNQQFPQFHSASSLSSQQSYFGQPQQQYQNNNNLSKQYDISLQQLQGCGFYQNLKKKQRNFFGGGQQQLPFETVFEFSYYFTQGNVQSVILHYAKVQARRLEFSSFTRNSNHNYSSFQGIKHSVQEPLRSRFHQYQTENCIAQKSQDAIVDNENEKRHDYYEQCTPSIKFAADQCASQSLNLNLPDITKSHPVFISLESSQQPLSNHLALFDPEIKSAELC